MHIGAGYFKGFCFIQEFINFLLSNSYFLLPKFRSTLFFFGLLPRAHQCKASLQHWCVFYLLKVLTSLLKWFCSSFTTELQSALNFQFDLKIHYFRIEIFRTALLGKKLPRLTFSLLLLSFNILTAFEQEGSSHGPSLLFLN